MSEEAWITCQDCGERLYGPLTPSEKVRITANCIVRCPVCRVGVRECQDCYRYGCRGGEVCP